MIKMHVVGLSITIGVQTGRDKYQQIGDLKDPRTLGYIWNFHMQRAIHAKIHVHQASSTEGGKVV